MEFEYIPELDLIIKGHFIRINTFASQIIIDAYLADKPEELYFLVTGNQKYDGTYLHRDQLAHFGFTIGLPSTHINEILAYFGKSDLLKELTQWKIMTFFIVLMESIIIFILMGL